MVVVQISADSETTSEPVGTEFSCFLIARDSWPIIHWQRQYHSCVISLKLTRVSPLLKQCLVSKWHFDCLVLVFLFVFDVLSLLTPPPHR